LIILWLIEGNFERILYLIDSLTKPKNEIPTPNVFGRNSLVYDVLTGQWSQRANQEDYDVMSERQRIDGLSSRRSLHEDAIVVKDLTKRFGKLIPIKAVNRLTFGVHKEECFGLLGVNGAGKTTTFKMLTGEETVSDGNAFIDFLDLRHNLKSFQQRIGYCPQFDALLDKITGRETIYLFARLRGMPEELIPSYTNDLVKMVDLGKHVDKCTEAYSGGNRRKLSLAIALCATPPVIFLDEPTSGVDPSARRKIWSTLVNIQEKYQSAIILTSHSMEECEALCSRIAIMVNGEFKCLGSVQHLRSKFGQGFTVMAKLKRELGLF
jgi:ATP-binding cassette subfamily A (ABC1) protein 3